MVRLSVVLAFLAACDLGTVTGPGGMNPTTPGVDAGSQPQTGTGMQTFTASVYTILQNKCQGCHTSSPNPNFCAATAASAYTEIVQLPAVVGTFDPANAPILTTIAGGHNGATYTAADISSITTWLNQEKAAR